MFSQFELYVGDTTDMPQDPVQHEASLPASAIVDQVGKEIRAVVTEAIETSQIKAKVEARKISMRWYWASLALSVAVATVGSWLVLSYFPIHHSADMRFQRGDSVEVCVRTPNAPDAHPLFSCRPVAPR